MKHSHLLTRLFSQSTIYLMLIIDLIRIVVHSFIILVQLLIKLIDRP